MKESISIIGGCKDYISHILLDPDGPYVLKYADADGIAKAEKQDARIQADIDRYAAALENSASIPSS